MDVKTTFLNGIIEEEVYIEQPQRLWSKWEGVPCLFCSEHLESVRGGAKAGALCSNKTCAEVFEGHSGVWSKIFWRWWSEVARVYKLKLGR
jgi:hypothetical protein